MKAPILKFMVYALLLLTSAALAQQASSAQGHKAVIDFITRVAPGYPVAGTTAYPDKSRQGLQGLAKTTTATERRKNYFMNGNKVVTEIYNYGGIAPGYDLIRGVNNGVWKGSSYLFQFSPLIGAAVTHPVTGQIMHIISDGLYDYPNLREKNPAGDTLWTFEPIPGYSDPASNLMASNPAPDKDKDGKPDSWPREWYNPTLGKYVWPGYLEQDATNADLEVFWAMDDRNNREFPYFPFPADSIRRGLGVQIDGRALQWSNTLAENTIFFVYTITNVSNKALDSAYFGIYGDCDVGGASPENTDDNGYFIPPYNYDGNHNVSNIPVYARSLVYFFDPDGVGALSVKVGYVACKFLESPGNPNDLVDNDGDGVINERQDDGMDNDADWSAASDDVGLDGIPNTQDLGEGDGLPTAGRRLASGALDPLQPGEPNFEFTDLDESDQIGLTSFNSWSWNSDKVSNDESIWARLKAGNFSEIIQNSDIVFVFGSGQISLAARETKRISMSLLFGETLEDLLTTAETVQRIYNANYRFFKPPVKPTLTAVPGDRKVTLYWDTKAEESVDPLTGKDFEGYCIYRSTDPSFSDIQTITDGRGNSFFATALKDYNGVEARWDVDKRDEPFKDLNSNGKFDVGEPYYDFNADGKWTAQITDWWKGYHLVTFQGRGIQYYLGNNRGLVHSFVDSNNVINGQTYYYALVAYDHGDSVGVPPTETTRKITVDPISSTYEFDLNTVVVVPGPRSSGYVPSEASQYALTHAAGIGNGKVSLAVMNDLAVPEGVDFRLSFADTLNTSYGRQAAKNYSVLRLSAVTDQAQFFDTNFYKLSHQFIDNSRPVAVSINNGLYTEGRDYVIDYTRGLIRRTAVSAIPVSVNVAVTYRYFPVFQSPLLNGEDGNAVLDGIKLKVADYTQLAFDSVQSKWSQGNSNYKFVVQLASIPVKRVLWPADYEITFSSGKIDSAKILIGASFITAKVNYSVREVTPNGYQRRIWTYLKENTATRDSVWSPGEEIILFTPFTRATTTDTLTWGVTIVAPTDSSKPFHRPADGDVLYIRTNRPFNTADQFTFRTTAGTYNNALAKSRLDNIYVVPNPYVGVNAIEPNNKLPGKTRGDRRIYFENLPALCTIRIYTMSGEYVAQLNHDVPAENGREFWNLLNADGFSVAYGIYFAHIEAPGIGDKVIKFAIIK